MNAVEIEQALSDPALQPFDAAKFPFASLAAFGNGPDTMPEPLRHAHAHDDEVLERIHFGGHFRNDTERREKLFDLHSRMVAKPRAARQAKARPAKKAMRASMP